MNRKKIVAGNWKMNCNFNEAIKLFEEVNEIVKETSDNVDVYIFPPAIYLSEIIKSNQNLKIGAQNGFFEDSGAFTGEVSIHQMKNLGVNSILIGHSERRTYFHEKNDDLAKKVNATLSKDLTPFYCVGESLEERENNSFEAVIEKQISEGLFHLSEEQIQNIVIAYEPVWAIGTGKTASAEQADEAHAFIRSLIAKKYSPSIAQKVSILYGGSCKPNNAKELFQKENIDGGLIGGAALNAKDFSAIIKSF